MEEGIRVNTFKKKHEHICYYCNKKIKSVEDLTVDHLTPVSRGGRNIESNMTICCHACNSEKSDMTEEEYLQFLQLKKLCKNKQEIRILRNIFLNNANCKDKYVEMLDCLSSIHTKIISLEDIKITRLFQNSPPNPKLIDKVMKYYNEHHELDKPIIISPDLLLYDGFARYNVAKCVGLTEIEAQVLDYRERYYGLIVIKHNRFIA